MRVVLGSQWRRGALAVVAGALPVPAFPAPSLWWWAYVALVPWLLLLRSADGGRRAAVEGWLGGTGFLLAAHYWLAPYLHVFLVVVAALLGLLWAPWGWLVRRRLAGAPGPGRSVAAVVLVPSAWLMIEMVRSWQYLGGPWALLGASQWQVPAALRLASLGGVWLVTVWVVAVNTVLTVLIAVPRVRTTAVATAVVCALVPASAWAWAPRPEPSGTVRVAVVQPGVMTSAPTRFATGERLTRQVTGRHVDLVVWGESSVGSDLDSRPDLRARLAALSARTEAPLLVNVDARRSDRPGIFKSSVLVGPEGPTGARYDKMRLVPFGEYVPARALLGWTTAVGPAARENRMRGDRPVVMHTGETGAKRVAVGPLVCFESAFPDMSRTLARDGARLLVTQSSTSSFQNSWAPQQHASLAAFRAVETWRPMVHATLTGVSAVYGPRGEPVGRPLGTDRSASAVYEVPLASGTSPYVRYGDWVPAVALGALLSAAAVAVAGRVRRGPGEGAGGEPDAASRTAPREAPRTGP
ncbi:MAG TPA: apolipoprotein N-acyltransferase [Streptomyces sp.]|nr:apolipoprotein N-acyltransferase [Streptomyces sp.]